MNAELRKRIEEAAENTLNGLNNNCYIHIDENTEDAYKDGFKDGAEFGYKEAITTYNDIIVDVANEFFGDYEQSCKLADKVMDKMNKLWEGEK